MSSSARGRTARARLAVVGAGPAGLAAAVEGHQAGFDVTLVDEYSRPGGQYYRGRTEDRGTGSPLWFEERGRGIAVEAETSVIDIDESQLITWSANRGCRSVGFDCLIVCTGANDRAVALPGWTLPGVLTAGGALAFGKAYHAFAGRRMAVGGSGPFLYPVAVALARSGARVTVLEATQMRESLSGAANLVRDPEILAQAVAYRIELAARGARILYGRIITAITGDQRADAIIHLAADGDWNPIPGTMQSMPIDGVALGFGFTPRVELAQLLGCAILYDPVSCAYAVQVDEHQRTSHPAVYAAGEATGVAGARVARLEGTLAALTAAVDSDLLSLDAYRRQTTPVVRALGAARRTQRWLTRAFRPRDGLWRLAHSPDIVCRCEEVDLGHINSALQANSVSPRSVKSSTRAGMGLCQGAICAPLITEILRTRHGYQPAHGVRDWSIRPPLRPVPTGDWPLSFG